MGFPPQSSPFPPPNANFFPPPNPALGLPVPPAAPPAPAGSITEIPEAAPAVPAAPAGLSTTGLYYPVTDISPEERRAKHSRYAYATPPPEGAEDGAQANGEAAAGDEKLDNEGEGGNKTRKRAAAADLF